MSPFEQGGAVPGPGQLTMIPAGTVFRPLARRTDPETSHAAAASINPGSSEGRILDALRFGPLTHEELEDVLEGPTCRGTITTACSRLSKRGLVVAVGSKLNSRRREVLIWALNEGDARG